MAAHAPLMRLQRMALAAGLIVMPDDRAASRIAMTRMTLLYWRGDGARRIRRTVRRYTGAQRLWIEIGSGVAIYVAAQGWWQLPLLAGGGVLAWVWG